MECVECGFVYADHGPPTVVHELTDAVRRCAGTLAGVVVSDGGDRRVRRHPAPGVWSALGYACHVRDVLLVQRERVLRTLIEESPEFERMHRDERATFAHYDDEDPRAVARQLTDAAGLLAAVLTGLDGGGWQRTGVYNFPEPAQRTIAWITTHTLHEVVHHSADIGEALGTV